MICQTSALGYHIQEIWGGEGEKGKMMAQMVTARSRKYRAIDQFTKVGVGKPRVQQMAWSVP
jgi:hypothetical protein